MREMCIDLLSLYYVTRDKLYLLALHELVDSEIREPRLQETVLHLDKLTTAAVQTAINRDNCLRLGRDDATNMRKVDNAYVVSPEAEIEANKLIRVYPAEIEATPEQTECLVFYVGFYEKGTCLLITPPTGDIQEVIKEVEDALEQL